MTPTLKLVPGLGSREQIPAFLNRQNLTESMVEVGTHRGEYLSYFAAVWKGKRLFGVDCWCEYDPSDPASLSDRDADKNHAYRSISQFPNVTLIHKFSHEAVDLFEDNSQDLVYIDANHQQNEIYNDLNLWWPKVKKGGFLAGHDFVCAEPEGGWGKNCQPAVSQFCAEHEIGEVILIPDPTAIFSFGIEKL